MKSLSANTVAQKIIVVRGHRVIMDSDIAKIYQVPTKVLNQAVRRNRSKFPPDFVFQLNKIETKELALSRSQNVTLNRGSNIKYRPFVFTEHGAIMAANVLNSPKAVQMSVYVVRAFIKMRGLIGDHLYLAQELRALEKELKGRLDIHEAAIVDVLHRVMKILEPIPILPEKKKPRIGFRTKKKS